MLTKQSKELKLLARRMKRDEELYLVRDDVREK